MPVSKTTRIRTTLTSRSIFRVISSSHFPYLPCPLVGGCPVSVFAPLHLAIQITDLFNLSLTIFLVAIVDWLLKDEPLSSAAVAGGLVIVVAFILLSWSTYREINEERRKR